MPDAVLFGDSFKWTTQQLAFQNQSIKTSDDSYICLTPKKEALKWAKKKTNIYDKAIYKCLLHKHSLVCKVTKVNKMS